MTGCGEPLLSGGICGAPAGPENGPRVFHASCANADAGSAPVVNLGCLDQPLRIGLVIQEELAPGWCWQRKDGTGIPMSFSSALLDIAGGIRRFLSDWEPEPGSPLSKAQR